MCASFRFDSAFETGRARLDMHISHLQDRDDEHAATKALIHVENNAKKKQILVLMHLKS